MKSNVHYSQGFTLIELVISILIVGVLGVVSATHYSAFGTSAEAVRIERAKVDNRAVGLGLLEMAENNLNGRLSAPYTAGAFNNAISDPANANLMTALRNNGIEANVVNDDGYTGQRVRVYQMITQNRTVPFFKGGGETVNIIVDTGVVYQTACQRGLAACNPTVATGVPGASIALTAGNVDTWNVAGTDIAPYMFSTYSLQHRWVRESAEKLFAIREALKTTFYHSMLAAPPGDTTNFYPAPTGAGALNLSGADPAANEGCRDGWYPLNAVNVNVLSLINLIPSAHYGVTPFGGQIEYCRDYDPENTGAGTPPHGVALRINRNISTGAAPVAAGNLILSF